MEAINYNQSKSNFRFGTSQRSFNPGESKPGPGAYSIYGQVGKVPKYLIPNQTYY